VESVHSVEGLALAAALIAIAAIAIEPLASRLEVPSPLVFLVGGLCLGWFWDASHVVAAQNIGGIGSLALVVILVDGGLRLGWGAFRRQWHAIAALGIGGTGATFLLVAVVSHAILSLGWQSSLVLGAVLSPTDPAAVFSVLAKGGLSSRRVPAILEGEAGVNDPVAIALTVALVEGASGGASPSALHVVRTMIEQGVIGALVGVAGGLLLGRVLGPRRPSIGSAPALLALAAGFAAYGAAALLGGSGFLAAYLLGLVYGDLASRPERDPILSLHGHLASLAEIGMFVLLGVTLTQAHLGGPLLPAIALALVAIFVIRPLVAVPILLAAGLRRNEALFGAWGGLKGAVPILLGSLPLSEGIPDASRLFALTGIAVLASLAIQGVTLGRVARALGLEEDRDAAIYASAAVSSPPGR
jgi:cell volume regulation protein A